MKSKILLLFFALFWLSGINAQNEGSRSSTTWQYGHCLKEVHFSGTTNTNYIPITKDDSSGEFLAPQFVKSHPDGCDVSTGGTIVEQEPVAYVSGTKARVKACFLTDCTHSYYIRGLGSYISVNQTSVRIEFPKQMVTPSGGQVVYDWRDANIAFVDNEVKYFENFTIQWQASEDGNNWLDIDENANQLFVTHSQPILSIASGHIEPTVAFHTSLFLGTKNANGKKIPNEIVGTIYAEFTDQIVNRVDGAGPIQYWGPNISTPGCWQTSQMLINLNGTCGGWAAFFEDIIRLQGISSSELSTVTYNNYVLSVNDVQKLNNDAQSFFGSNVNNLQALPPDDPNLAGIRSDFFVKNWDFSNSGVFVINDYFNTVNGITPITIPLGNGNSILIKEQNGASGQGNVDPRLEFENHAIVKYDGKYYDPSYGSSIQPNANSWETPALDGFGSVMLYNYNNQFFYVNWVGHLNDATLQSNISP